MSLRLGADAELSRSVAQALQEKLWDFQHWGFAWGFASGLRQLGQHS